MFFLTSSCYDLDPIIRLVKFGIIPIIQFGIPIILVLLGMLDFGKAVLARTEDEINAAQKMFIKRLMYAVATFLVFTIVTAVFNLLVGTNASSDGNDWKKCWDDIKK